MEKEELKSLRGQRIKIFSGNANLELAQDICKYLEVPLSQALVGKFTNGETRVRIEENVRGMDVVVIQPTCPPVNDHLMELLVMMDALSRSSAKSITCVIPYFGYAKQEKKTAGREPISAKLVANLITTAAAARVITLDLHAAAIQGFFDIPVDNLYALPLIVDYYRKLGLASGNTVVVSPDAGGVARARAMAEQLNATLAIIFKKRPQPDEAEVMDVVGEVKDRVAVIVDDMISTGGTLVKAAQRLKENGATRVYAAATHAILAGTSVDLIHNSPIEEVLVTDSIPLPPAALASKFRCLPVARLLGEAIRRNYFNLSVSKLFA